MNSTVHIDLTPVETARIVKVTEYIANHDTNCTIGRIKRLFDLSDTEYETMMELAMPQIRAVGHARKWRRELTNFVRALMHATIPPSKLPPEKRSKLDWSDDPVIRLEKLIKIIEAKYNEFYKPGSLPLEDDGEDDDE